MLGETKPSVFHHFLRPGYSYACCLYTPVIIRSHISGKRQVNQRSMCIARFFLFKVLFKYFNDCILAWIPAVVYVGLIFAVSSIPGSLHGIIPFVLFAIDSMISRLEMDPAALKRVISGATCSTTKTGFSLLS